MSGMNYVVHQGDIDQFISERSGKVVKIARDILSNLPDQLSKEALANGYYLERITDIGDTKFSSSYTLKIKTPSPELRRALKAIYTDIICLREL